MKMNPKCFAAISNRIDYCNNREYEILLFETCYSEERTVSENLPSHYTLLRTISTRFFLLMSLNFESRDEILIGH